MIIAFTYSRMSQSILGFSNSIMGKVSEAITEKIYHLFDDAEDEVLEAAKLMSFSEDISLENASLISYILQVIKDHPNFYSIYYGRPDGSMLGAANLNSGNQTQHVFDPSKPLLPNSTYILRVVDRSSPNPSDAWYYKDKNLEPLDSESTSTPDYNASLRPWYIGASQNKDRIFLTPYYPFDLTGEHGITVSKAIYNSNGDLIGVVGIDITLNLFSRFLTEQKIGKTGKAFILNSSGQVIIPQDTPTSGITKEVIAEAYRDTPKDERTSFVFTFDNIRYAASEHRFPATETFDWIILIIAPLRDFMGEFLKTQQDVVLISVAILILASFLVIYFSNRISIPIVALANETNKIRNLDFGSEIRIHSNIHEIKLMDDSIAAMRVAIRSFGHYIPKEIVMQLIEKGKEITIGGEKKETTVFFSDIEGFTTIAETYETEKLMSLLSEYFDGLSKIILKNQGNIDKFIGDGIMALWGAPRALPSQAVHACAAALECQAYLKNLNERLQKEKKPILRTRIGIDTGEVIVGNVGTAERMNYTAMGNTVNTAARLQTANKIYHTLILLSERVQEKIKDQFLLRPIDIVELKGKKEKTKIYELMNQNDPSQIELSTHFTKAFNAFQEQDLSQAKTIFLQIQKAFPNDVPTKIYLDRLK